MGKSFWNQQINKSGHYISRKNRQTFWWLLFIFLSFAILSIGVLSSQIYLNEGDIATEDVYYQGSLITYTSQLKTDQSKNKAANNVKQIYSINQQVLVNIFASADQIFRDLMDVQVNNSLNKNEKLDVIHRLIPGQYKDQSVVALLDKNAGQLNDLQDDLKNIIGQVMHLGILEEEVPQAQKDIQAKMVSVAELKNAEDFFSA
ncbi:MAG: hypothetical protein RR396_03330, partial [Clostridiales bacterium]